MRRTLLLSATLALLAGGACRRPPRPPHVLLVSIDTLRADHCSLYGYPRPTTPRLDAFARAGVVFEQAYAPMATTAPSHATMLTGLLPRRHGVLKNGSVLGQRRDTLAERLRAGGYLTHAVVSSFVLDRRFGLAQGFVGFYDARDGTGKESLFQPADRAVARAKAWLGDSGYLSGAAPEPPFFLWLHLFDPHEPYTPPPAHSFEAVASAGPLASSVAAYDGEIRFADAELGALLDALAAAGRLDDTLLVVTADHGEGLMTHGHLGHGPHLYEEAVRVPLVFRWPRGLQQPRRVAAPAGLVDLMPTVLELVGLGPFETRFDGRSLADILRGSSSGDPNRPFFFQRRSYAGEPADGVRAVGEKLGVRLGRLKYIEAPEEASFELFDLEADPGEARNLLPEHAEQAQELAKLVDAWRRTARERATVDESPETIEALRALGYVQ